MKIYRRVLGDALTARDEAQALARRVRAETPKIEQIARQAPPLTPDEIAAMFTPWLTGGRER